MLDIVESSESESVSLSERSRSKLSWLRCHGAASKSSALRVSEDDRPHSFPSFDPVGEDGAWSTSGNLPFWCLRLDGDDLRTAGMSIDKSLVKPSASLLLSPRAAWRASGFDDGVLSSWRARVQTEH